MPGADGQPKSLRAALTSDYIITQPSKEFLKAIVEKAGPALADLARPDRTIRRRRRRSKITSGASSSSTSSLAHPTVKWGAEEFVKTLRKLQPRLYSIASSLKANPESVHLTVATVRYESHGRQARGRGVHLPRRALGRRRDGGRLRPHGQTFPPARRIPTRRSSWSAPAPASRRSARILQERKATGAKGKNWLFFGEQTRAKDFLYEEELTALQADGVLNKLDVAFSRDQAQKIYVQDKMQRERGASCGRGCRKARTSYVCGDGARMAKDVDTELHLIAETRRRQVRRGSRGLRRGAEEGEALQEGRVLAGRSSPGTVGPAHVALERGGAVASICGHAIRSPDPVRPGEGGDGARARFAGCAADSGSGRLPRGAGPE